MSNDKIQALITYAGKLEIQLKGTPPTRHDSPEAIQAWREFLERDLRKTNAKIEALKMAAPARK